MGNSTAISLGKGHTDTVPSSEAYKEKKKNSAHNEQPGMAEPTGSVGPLYCQSTNRKDEEDVRIFLLQGAGDVIHRKRVKRKVN